MNELDDLKSEMLATSLSAEEEDRLKGKLSWNDHLDAWELPQSSFSDYGGSLVNRSNSAYWVKKYPEIVELRHGGHNSVWTVIPDEKLNTIDGADLERIVDDLDSLEDYPLLDEDGHSTMQMEAQWEAWDEDGARDEYRKALMEKFGGYGLNAFAAAYVPNGVLDEIERENDNGDWEEQDGGTMWRNTKRLAEKTDIDDILGDGEMAKQYRKAKLDVWKNGFNHQFIDALMKRFGQESGVVAAITRNVGMFDLADSLLESVNGWAVNDAYDPAATESQEPMIKPDWEDLQPAIDDMHPSRITQAGSHVKDPRQLTFPLRKRPDAARVVADSLLERSQVIPAPAWLVERMERLKKLPRPTLEQVKRQMEASREQSFKTNLPDRYS